MKAVAYYRVSTAAQGRSGLGLEAQKAAVADLARQREMTTLAEFTEVESGKRNDRPVLAQALHHARITNATLVIAKLDRLSRNAAFLLTLRDSGVRFLAADVPDANDLTHLRLPMVERFIAGCPDRYFITLTTKRRLDETPSASSLLSPRPNGRLSPAGPKRLWQRSSRRLIAARCTSPPEPAAQSIGSAIPTENRL